MGCTSCGEMPGIPPEVEAILKELDEKAPEIINACQNEKQKILEKKEKLLSERDEKVSKAVNEKLEEDKLKELLLELNLKEIDIEKELIITEVEKMHKLYEIGKSLADKLKQVTIDQLKKKLEKAPSLARAALNTQLETVNNSNSKEFLDSEFGKPLKTALEKYGMSQVVLQNVMNEYKEERKKRREEERTKYNISQNEFPPDDELDISAEELYNLIFDEYKDGIKSTLKEKLKVKTE
jgi:hypothetical protein